MRKFLINMACKLYTTVSIRFLPDSVSMYLIRYLLTEFRWHSLDVVDECVTISIRNCWFWWDDVVRRQFHRWNSKTYMIEIKCDCGAQNIAQTKTSQVQKKRRNSETERKYASKKCNSVLEKKMTCYELCLTQIPCNIIKFIFCICAIFIDMTKVAHAVCHLPARK